jgi:hypothetical protein
MKAALLVLVLAACGSQQPAPSPPAPAADPPPAGDPPPDATPAPAGPKTDGTEGAVCAWGRNSEHHGEKVAACQGGLRCCYGCGIPGCNSTCMAVTDCPKYP